MKKIILSDNEYEMLKRLLEAIPPADFCKLLPEATGADLHYYRCLLTKLLRKDYHFPKSE